MWRTTGQPRDGRLGTGPGRAEEGRRSTRNLRRVVCGRYGDLRDRRKKRRQNSVGSSVDVDRGHLENRLEGEREALGAQGLNKKCKDDMPPSSRLIRGFHKKHH